MKVECEFPPFKTYLISSRIVHTRAESVVGFHIVRCFVQSISATKSRKPRSETVYFSVVTAGRNKISSWISGASVSRFIT